MLRLLEIDCVWLFVFVHWMNALCLIVFICLAICSLAVRVGSLVVVLV